MAYAPIPYAPSLIADPGFTRQPISSQPFSPVPISQFNPTFSGGMSGLYSSGGNYYLPFSSLASGAVGLQGSTTYDDQGNPIYPDQLHYVTGGANSGSLTPLSGSIPTSAFGWTPQQVGQMAQSYADYTNPETHQLSDPMWNQSQAASDWWRNQSGLNFTTDPTSGQQYYNLGANPFTINPATGQPMLDNPSDPSNNNIPAFIGMGLLGGAAAAAGAGAGSAAAASEAAAGEGAAGAGATAAEGGGMAAGGGDAAWGVNSGSGAGGTTAAGGGTGGGTMDGGGDLFGGDWSSDPAAWQSQDPAVLDMFGSTEGAPGWSSDPAAWQGGGGGMFDNINWSNLGNNAASMLRNFLGGGRGGGPNIPGIVGAGLSAAGANQMTQAYRDAINAARDAGNFTPYNISTGLNNLAFGPGGMTSTLSPAASGLQSDYLAAARSAAAGSQNPNDITASTLGLLRQQAAPYEAQQLAELRANLAAKGTTGLGVGPDIGGAGPANPELAALFKAQNEADVARQINAITTGQQVATATANRGLAFGQGAQQLDQQGLLAGQLGGYLGGLRSNAALTSARLQIPSIYGIGATRGGMLSGAGQTIASGGNVGELTGMIPQRQPLAASSLGY